MGRPKTAALRKPILSNASVEKQVADGIKRLRFIFDEDFGAFHLEELTSSGIKWTTDLLLGKQRDSGGWAVDPIYGDDATLPPTDEAYEEVKPTPQSNCEIDQVIRYEPTLRRVRVNMRLLKKMNKTQTAALYLHEGLYAYATSIGVSQEKSSLRVRRTISYIMSGHAFAQAPTPAPGEKFVECLSSDHGLYTNFDIFRDEKGLYVYTKKIAGIAIFGYNKNYLSWDYPIDESLAKCIENVTQDGGPNGCQMQIRFTNSQINNGIKFTNTYVEHDQLIRGRVQIITTPDHKHDGVTDSITCKLQTQKPSAK